MESKKGNDLYNWKPRSSTQNKIEWEVGKAKPIILIIDVMIILREMANKYRRRETWINLGRNISFNNMSQNKLSRVKRKIIYL